VAAPRRRHLIRSVGLVGAIGVAVAGMAPTMAMNLNPQQLAEHVGSAVPVVFVLATIGITLIAWCFARLSSLYPNAGAAYRFAGETIGARTGFVAGWSLAGTYLAFGGVFVGAVTIFSSSVLASTGLWASPSADVIAVAATALLIVLALAPVRRVTIILLVIELASVVAMVALSLDVVGSVDFGRLGVGAADLLWPADGVSGTQVALALSFALLSFAGFEQVTTLGEDALNPRREIPIALLGTAIIGGILYTLVTAAQIIGIFDMTGGMQAFEESEGLLQTLGNHYVSTAVGTTFEVFAMCSAFAGGLVVVVSTSRIVYAIARDLTPDGRFAQLSKTGDAPRLALIACSLAGLVEYIVLRVAFDASVQDVFFWAGTTGALLILIPYLLMCVGAGFSFWRVGGSRRLEVVVPVLACALILYTLRASLFPLGEGAYAVIPFVVAGWVVIAVAIVVIRPGIVERIRTGLLATDL
jgi:amino acid transporter